ncbi:MAG: hypothetical protein FJ358_07055 [Thaumarchaeota archaeon]|nr:hypothetical protein [Nitrososphaerota archaeon]
MGKIRSGLSVLASAGVLSGALFRGYLSLYWRTKRQTKKTTEKARKILQEEGFTDDAAERLAEIAVPDFSEALSIGRLISLGREQEEP